MSSQTLHLAWGGPNNHETKTSQTIPIPTLVQCVNMWKKPRIKLEGWAWKPLKPALNQSDVICCHVITHSSQSRDQTRTKTLVILYGTCLPCRNSKLEIVCFNFWTAVSELAVSYVSIWLRAGLKRCTVCWGLHLGWLQRDKGEADKSRNPFCTLPNYDMGALQPKHLTVMPKEKPACVPHSSPSPTSHLIRHKQPHCPTNL